MAQTKKKRRRKHRGTQGGRIDTRPARGRPQSRAEARGRVRGSRKKKGGAKTPQPPNRRSALQKGALGAVLFIGVLALFGTNPIGALIGGVVMFPAYSGMAYLMDRFFYRRHLRQEAQKRAEREAQRTGAGG